MKPEQKKAVDDLLRALKEELRDEAAVKEVTAYGIARDTGMNIRTAYSMLNPDEVGSAKAIVLAGLHLGLKLTWTPITPTDESK